MPVTPHPSRLARRTPGDIRPASRATWSDEELLLHVRGGDPAAFGEVYRRFERDARRLARTMVSRDDVDDVVSEAFAKMLRAIDRGNGPVDGPARYLMVTVRTTAASHYERRAKNARIIDRASTRSVPNDTRFAIEDTDLLEAFRSLQPRWRQVIWWTEVEGMRPAEVAERTGLTPSAASALAYRARRALREAYAAASAVTDADHL